MFEASVKENPSPAWRSHRYQFPPRIFAEPRAAHREHEVVDRLDLLEERLDRALLRDIENLGAHGVAAAEALGGSLELRLVGGGDGDARTLGERRARDTEADARGAADDEDVFACEWGHGATMRGLVNQLRDVCRPGWMLCPHLLHCSL